LIEEAIKIARHMGFNKEKDEKDFQDFKKDMT
jgi:hypothetical protein